MKKTNYLFLIVLCLIILSFIGCSKNEEKNAQQIANNFISDLYTVSNEEVENYKSLLDVDPSEAMETDVYNAVQINDDVLKSLTTDDAYEILLKNRYNLKFTDICYRNNCTMQAAEIKLSENNSDINNNEADYTFEVKLKLISDDGTETEGTAKGKVSLSKIDDDWKITSYGMGTFPNILMELPD
ncbi:hypothetical protein [Sedimentibacter sp.]|uniref:hypothetical protein n=1 Tax=Sedimentibacter sp. TaxID=1960295 RepID=UPI0028A0126C|nr:hypothetical protein [Sedimentibacter sp.]